MAIIERGEIFSSDVLKEIEAALELIIKLKSELSSLADQSKKKIDSNPVGNTKEIIDFNNEVEKAKIIISEINKNNKTRAILIERVSAAQKKENQDIAEANDVLRTLNAEQKKEIELRNKSEAFLKRSKNLKGQEIELLKKQKLSIAELNLATKKLNELESARAGSLQSMRAQLSLSTLAYSKLSEEELKNANIGGVLQKRIRGLSDELKIQESALGNNTRNVGNYKSALDGLKTSFKSLASAAGITFGIVGAFRVLKSAIGTVREFDQSLADLSAITGATGEDLKFLEGKALELSSTSTKSASEVVEAFKLIASAKPELLTNVEALNEVTQAAILLSEASGEDLPSSAKNLGQALNALQLPVSETGRVVNVLAAAAQLGSQEIPFLNDAFSKFGGIAAQAGVSIEQSASAVEILGAAIPEASIVGTNFRNILTKLQIEAEKSGRKFLGLGEELDLLAPNVDNITLLTEKFGETNLLAIQTLISQRDELGNLTEKISTNETAQEQAEARTNTLNGAVLKLSNAYQSYILELNNSTGAGNILTKGLKFLANNLKAVINFVGIAVSTFLVYKGVVLATNKIIALNTVRTQLMANAQFKSITGIKSMIVNFKALNATMKANVIGLVVTAIAGLVAVLSTLNKETSIAAQVSKTLSDVRTEATKIVAEEKSELDLLLSVARNENISKEERLKAIKRLNEISPEYLGNLTLENVATKEGIELIEGYIRVLDKKALAQAVESKRSELQKQLIDAETKSIEDYISTGDKIVGTLKSLAAGGIGTSKAFQVSDAIKERERLISGIKAEQTALEDLIKKKLEANEITLEDLFGGNDGGGGGGGAKKEVEDFTSKLKQLKTQLEDIQKEREKILGSPELFSTEKFNKLTKDAEKLNTEIRELSQILDGSGNNVENNIEEERLKGLIDLKEQSVKDQIKKQEEFARITGKFLTNQIQKELDQEYAYRQELLDIQREFAKEGKTILESELIDLQFDAKQKKLNDEKLKDQEDFQNKLTDIAEKGNEDRVAIIDNEDEIKKLKDRNEALITLADEFTKRITELSNQRIRNIENEISASENREATLRELASQGSEDAIDNIAFEQKKRAELALSREKELKRQKRAELGLLAIKGYIAKTEAQDKNPLTSTITDIATLSNFIDSLASFWVGTEKVSDSLRKPKLSGKDGHIIRVDGSERIMTGKQNRKLGNISNEKLSEIGEMYNHGFLKPFDFRPNIEQVENKEMIIELKQVKKAIEKIEIPETYYSYDRLTDLIKETVKTKTRVTNTTRKNRL